MSKIYREPSIDASYQIFSSFGITVSEEKIKINLVGSIYGRSSIKIAHSVPIRLQTWLPQAIFVSDWQELPVAAIFVNGSGRNEQYL
jgi:hypothetical protein